jgi:hypothetical protein
MPSRRATCCPAPPRRSWRSSAPGASRGPSAPLWEASRSSSRDSPRSWPLRSCSSAPRRIGSAAPERAQGPRWLRWRCTPVSASCRKAGGGHRRTGAGSDTPYWVGRPRQPWARGSYWSYSAAARSRSRGSSRPVVTAPACRRGRSRPRPPPEPAVCWRWSGSRSRWARSRTAAAS